eukprot:gene5087-34885_t
MITALRGTPLSASNGSRSRRARNSDVQVRYYAMLSSDLVSNVEVVSRAVSVGLLLGGAVMVMRQQPEIDDSKSGLDNEPCPRCQGSGYEACMCGRWSDGDMSGCTTCSKTGYMACRACRGGGTAIPLFSHVR